MNQYARKADYRNLNHEEKFHVLVIRRNGQDIQEKIGTALPWAGTKFEMECVDCLEAGLERLNSNGVDAILLDPSLDGAEGLEAFHKLQIGAPEMPVVLLVSTGQEKLAISALAEGALDYLIQEHLDGNILQRCLRYAVEKHRLETALGGLTSDHVTGLYNRHSFLILAEQQLKLAPRSRGLLVFYAELEGVQAYNPPLTRLEERRILIRTAKILRKTFRDSDVVARWGRFEFAAVAVDAAESNASLLMSRLDRNLRNFNAQNEPRYHLSLSAGMASWDAHNSSTLGMMISQADEVRRRNRYRPQVCANAVSIS